MALRISSASSLVEYPPFLKDLNGLPVQSGPIFGSEIPGRDDNHRDVAPLRTPPKGLQKGEPVHFGHHEIQQDHVRNPDGHAFESDAPVLCLGHGPSVLFRRPPKDCQPRA